MVSEQSPQGGDHAGPSAERRQGERYGKNDGSSAHRGASAMGVASMAAFLAAATGAPPPSVPLVGTPCDLAEAQLFCAFFALKRTATDVMGWEGPADRQHGIIFVVLVSINPFLLVLKTPPAYIS